VEQFASGWKRNYYGKGDVIAYRLRRTGATAGEQNPVFGANVKMLVYGDAFWPTYTTGDNTGLIATDSMKNFIQRETLNYAGPDLEDFCRFLGTKFLGIYPQVEGVQISADEIPHVALRENGVSFAPAGPEYLTSRFELSRGGTVEVASGIRGFRLLRLGGSAFRGFVRDEYTTLPDIKNRPLRMGLDLVWTYTSADAGFSAGKIPSEVRDTIHQVFEGFESGSIQEVIYQIGVKLLADIPVIAEIHLEAENRTWDTVAELGEEIGIYTDARPPYGCLGLRLKR
jgi:urate oxidase/2-oxo-4-hydroxy-4-carboxy-5-ureidoimidazoline decarboxylase